LFFFSSFNRVLYIHNWNPLFAITSAWQLCKAYLHSLSYFNPTALVPVPKEHTITSSWMMRLKEAKTVFYLIYSFYVNCLYNSNVDYLILLNINVKIYLHLSWKSVTMWRVCHFKSLKPWVEFSYWCEIQNNKNINTWKLINLQEWLI